MKIHYTGRQVEITPTLRSQVEEKLNKIHKILGRHLDLEARVIVSLERHRYGTEVTLPLKNHPLVGLGITHDLYSSLQEALEKLEKQVIKYKDRSRERKRRPRASRQPVPGAVGEAGRGGGPLEAAPSARPG